MSVDDYITALCPGLASDAAKATFVAMATEQTSSTFFGTRTANAIALRACHIWAMVQKAKASPVGGSVASITEGKLSMSFFAAQGMQVSDLGQTTYGVMLKALMGPAFSVTGGSLP